MDCTYNIQFMNSWTADLHWCLKKYSICDKMMTHFNIRLFPHLKASVLCDLCSFNFLNLEMKTTEIEEMFLLIRKRCTMHVAKLY